VLVLLNTLGFVGGYESIVYDRIVSPLIGSASRPELATIGAINHVGCANQPSINKRHEQCRQTGQDVQNIFCGRFPQSSEVPKKIDTVFGIHIC